MNSNLTYTRCGDYDIPNLILSETEAKSLGKYGRMRKNYLKEHRPVLWNSMILSEKQHPHLREIDKTANHRLEQMMIALMKRSGVTDSLKANDPLKWAGLMNNLKAQAEEIIFIEDEERNRKRLTWRDVALRVYRKDDENAIRATTRLHRRALDNIKKRDKREK